MHPLYIVTSTCRNVGLTTFAKHGLAARLGIAGKAGFIEVRREVAADAFARASALSLDGPVVIDASFGPPFGQRANPLLPRVTKFVVPCNASSTTIEGAIYTVNALRAHGVDAARIAVVAIRVGPYFGRSELSPLNVVRRMGVHVAANEVSESFVYMSADDEGMTVGSLAALPDLMQEMLNEVCTSSLERLATRIVTQRVATQAQAELDAVMDELGVGERAHQ